MGLLTGLKGRWAAHKFKTSALGVALIDHTQEFFYRDYSLANFSQANKDKFINDFYNKVVEIGTADNPAIRCRELLAEYVLNFAGLSVCCLKSDEMDGQPYGNSPYISGTLWRYVTQLAEINEELRHYKWKTPDADVDELVSFANARCALMLYYMNGLNMVRIDMGDRDNQKDWYKPFVEAMIVWEEDNMREKLGLPSLFHHSIRALPYSTYLNLVLDGAANPFYEFRKDWPDLYLSGEGPRKRPNAIA